MKRFKAVGLAILISVMGFWIPANNVQAQECSVSARAAVVYDPQSDTVLYEVRGQEQLPMASTTKIMTAYLVLESAELSDWRVTVSETAVSQEGSSSGLKAGDVIRLSDLAACMLLASGNEAAVAGAEAVAGSEEAFVARMNEQAKAWGLTDTHFNTASGLDGETHYTTARDLAKLASHAMENEAFCALWSAKEQKVSVQGVDGTMRTISLTNHNKLLWQMEGCIGGKTGYTQKSGRCLVSCAEREGARLIAVTLHDPDDWSDHEALMTYGFSQMTRLTVKETEAVATVTTQDGGSFQAVPAQEEIGFVLPKEKQNVVRQVNCPIPQTTPTEGDTVGQIEYWLQEKKIGQISLVAQQVVAPPENLPWWEEGWQALLSFLGLA